MPRTRRRKEDEPVAFDERILGGSDFVREVLSDAQWSASSWADGGRTY